MGCESAQSLAFLGCRGGSGGVRGWRSGTPAMGPAPASDIRATCLRIGCGLRAVCPLHRVFAPRRWTAGSSASRDARHPTHCKDLCGVRAPRVQRCPWSPQIAVRLAPPPDRHRDGHRRQRHQPRAPGGPGLAAQRVPAANQLRGQRRHEAACIGDLRWYKHTLRTTCSGFACDSGSELVEIRWTGERRGWS